MKYDNSQALQIPDQLILSVVIPARNEFPSIVHTIYSIWHAWEADGYDPLDMEIIIVDNCSAEWENERYNFNKPADRGTTSYFMGRGAYWASRIRVLYDPIAGNHSARNKGARIARGKYLFFSDAHMAYRPGFFKNMLKTVEESGGLVHGGIAWLGAYPPHMNDGNLHGVGLGYTLKLGEEIKGTWQNYQLFNGEGEKVNDWWYIPALGHCSVGVNRKQFLEFGGYPDVHRSYGGGEFYLNMKWWMYGSSVALHPECIGYHLCAARDYTYHHDDYICNVLGISYALGMDDWRERAYINWLRRGRKDVLDKMMKRTEEEYKEDRKFIEKKRKMTFNELLVKRPWDELNKKKHGNFIKSKSGNSASLSIFHHSWLELLSQAPQCVQDMYNNSKYQKDLDKFIRENFKDYIYKREQYEK